MKTNYLDKSLFLLFSIFPISILTGSFLINLNIFLISLIFIFGWISNLYSLKNQRLTFYLIFFFALTLLINLFFSKNLILSYPRVIKIFIIIFFIISFGYILNNFNKDKIKNLYKIWVIVFLIVSFDLIIEYFVGKNIIGLVSIYPGKRLGSFTGTESVIGHYYLGFCLITLSYAKLYLKIKNLNLILAIFFIAISFLIGERANFIRTFIIISSYSFLIHNTKITTKIFTIVSMLIIFVIFLNLNQSYKTR